MKVVPTYDFFNDNTPLLDVRSPAEFTSGHILGAISFPLFTDVERADVGTLYKQMSREAAIKRGLELIGPKMVSMIEQAESLNSRTFRLYCWRGGMRSRSVAWLLETYGFNCQVLEGGYKSYRKTTNELIEDELKLIVLSGLTGTRKTAILKALKEKGEQVIDLENLAGHQGSSFGNLENTEQPSTEQFHNLIFDSCRNLDSNRPVWIEDESFMIGRCALPQSLYNLKESSPHIVL
ncbi:MAG: tRNA 2-selenouridine(34) synthase MnmH, partial [Flavobacteriales bacterium]|nr:tRNA 2-selenouridine(34) synthase MnmH [Flavobacteriales bacterium]